MIYERTCPGIFESRPNRFVARVQVEGVQIFPQTRTVQDFELLPLPLRSTRQEEQELFLVPRQNL